MTPKEYHNSTRSVELPMPTLEMTLNFAQEYYDHMIGLSESHDRIELRQLRKDLEFKNKIIAKYQSEIDYLRRDI
jgi:hypothetical protein